MPTRTRFWLLFTAAILVTAWAGHAYVDEQHRIAAERAAPNYSLIEPGIYLGGRPDKPPEADAVLNLSPDRDTFSAAIYEWQPIRDSKPAPTLEWLQHQVTWIDTQRRAGHTVFVHCDFGASRSGMVAAAYFMLRDHLTVPQALDFLRSKRSMVHPNSSFMELLTQWQASLQSAGKPSPTSVPS